VAPRKEEVENVVPGGGTSLYLSMPGCDTFGETQAVGDLEELRREGKSTLNARVDMT
jgi:hypothetical protein